MSKKIDFKAVLAAAAGGAGFTIVTEAIARKNDFMAENFSQAKGALGVGIGTALLYFGKGEAMKAAGYAIIGDGGGSLGSALSTAMAEADVVQGTTRAAIARRNPGKPAGFIGRAAAPIAAASNKPRGMVARLKDRAARAKASAPGAAVSVARKLASKQDGRGFMPASVTMPARRATSWRTGPRAHLY